MKCYFDNAASTKIHPKVIEKMLPFIKDSFGNPSSIHSFGREMRVAIEEARESIADLIGADPGEIYFFSNGTEANNFAFMGIINAAFEDSGRRSAAFSSVEHQCIIEPASYLKAKGFDLLKLDVDNEGSPFNSSITHFSREKLSLLSLIHVNNETGHINHIDSFAKIAKDSGAYFHSDTVQSIGKLRIEKIKQKNINSITGSAHKFHGPKGAAFAFIKSGTPVSPFILGGSQERNRRGGTENPAAIIGMAEALKIAYEEMEENYKWVTGLNKKFVEGLNEIDKDGITLNISQNYSPYVLSATFNSEYYNNDAEAMLMYLDINGVAASNGAACTSGTLKPSHVIKAIGHSDKNASGTIRFSFSRFNNEKEVFYTLEVLNDMSKKFRIN